MKGRFEVLVERVERIERLEGMWPPEQERGFLEQLLDDESGDIGDADVTEMLLMSLQDLEPHDAVEAILAYLIHVGRLDSSLSAGSRAHLSHEWADTPQWEYHADIQQHCGLFEAGIIAYAAFPRRYPKPVARRIQISVTAKDDDGTALLSGPASLALALRWVAPCAPNGILYRLFDESIEGDNFPEASHIAWEVSKEDGAFYVTGSGHWFSAIDPGQNASVRAGHDTAQED